VEFEWGEEQDVAQKDLKMALITSQRLLENHIDYGSEAPSNIGSGYFLL